MQKLAKPCALMLTTLVVIVGFVTPVAAAELSFGAPANALTVGCKQLLPIWLDTAGVESNALDVEISYDVNAIQIVDSLPNQAGVQILPSKAFQTFFYNQVAGGKIKVAAGSADFAINGKKEVGTIEFIPLVVGSINITFKFSGVGNTLDSNVAAADSSKEVLSGVKNITLELSAATANCPVVSVPVVEFVYPQAGQTDVSPTAQILFKITDSLAGIDLDSLVIELDGQTYTASSSRLKVSGDKNAYIFSLLPNYSDTNSARTLQLKVTGKGLSGAAFTDSVSFTLKVTENAGPIINTGSSTFLEWIADRDLDLLNNINVPLGFAGWGKFAFIFSFLSLLLLVLLLAWHKVFLAPFKFLKILLFNNLVESNTLIIAAGSLKTVRFAQIKIGKAGKEISFTDKFCRGNILVSNPLEEDNLELTYPGMQKYLAPLATIATRQTPYIFALKGNSYLNIFLWFVWKLLALISLVAAVLGLLASYSIQEVLLALFILLLLVLFW